ncbi:MAG: hypothetical protein Fur0035_16630 [Anaerolineales bacterium]
MSNPPLQLPADYWKNFTVSKHDIEFLQNYLFETEIPLAETDLVTILVQERIRQEREALTKQQKNEGAAAYLPAETYQTGQKLTFPALNWHKGEVKSVRAGINPQLGAFDVLEIAFEDGDTRLFAAGLAEHALNHPAEEIPDPQVDPAQIAEQFGEELAKKMEMALLADESLVKVAGLWFPRALLVDIGVGHLNLAEAVLEMAGGQPLTVAALMEQIDLPGGVNAKLTEFSLNYALQEDGRFDEVGPLGQVLWCLQRLEPDEVQHVPAPLKYTPLDYDRAALTPEMLALEMRLDDELSENEQKALKAEEVTLTLSYPHWRAGTLPVSPRVRNFFPTAYESARVRFLLVDARSGEKIPAWVVREQGYVYGLKAWFEKNKLIPGAQVTVRRSKTPGEVILDARTHRPIRDYVRTVLVGSDGGLVFALIKQELACDFHDRMVTMVPDVEAIDKAVAQLARGHYSLEKILQNVMRELSKLTPQGHVHAEELYSAVNILRRVPPAPLLATLASSSAFIHVGDLYFRLADSQLEE